MCKLFSKRLILHMILHTYIHIHTYTYAYTYTYSFTAPSSAQVRLNVEFIMKKAKLQYAMKSNK